MFPIFASFGDLSRATSLLIVNTRSSRAVMGYMRALPAFRLFYDYKAKFQAEGRDLFELRLIQQPIGTSPFDSGTYPLLISSYYGSTILNPHSNPTAVLSLDVGPA